MGPWLIPIISGTIGYASAVIGPKLFAKDGTGNITVDTKGKDVMINPVVAVAALVAAAYFIKKSK